MKSFIDLKELVEKKGYGTFQYKNINGDTVYLSSGVRETFLENEKSEQQLAEVVTRFQNKDYGNAEEYGKIEREGHEYGRYELEMFEGNAEDTAVWVHRTENALLVFFKFER